MNGIRSEECAGERRRSGGWRAIARGAADGLHLAAAPTFALMALLTAVHDGGMQQMRCMSVGDISSWNSMSLMYLLMSAGHAAPWIRLAAGRR
ncbi:MAG: hypothetical protein ACTHJ1_18340 [Bordetella sp.]|uniref:hypothetical protein n=1 Tax=Bordetella sp. TaxID=28081 RepID=UPI003F7C83CF